MESEREPMSVGCVRGIVLQSGSRHMCPITGAPPRCVLGAAEPVVVSFCKEESYLKVLSTAAVLMAAVAAKGFCKDYCTV